MNLIYISLVSIIALINIIFAVRVLSSPSEKIVKNSFAIFALTVSLWIILDFSLYQKVLENYQTLLNRLNLASICVMILYLSYFVSVFPRTIFKINWLIKSLTIIATTLLVFIILFTNKVVKSAFWENYGSNFNQGNLFYVFAAFATIFALYSVVILIIKYIKFQGEEKQQIKYVLYGIAFLTFFNLLFNLFIPMITKNFALGRLGSYSSVFFVGFTAYAILKAKMFNLKVILTEAAVVIIDVISVVSIFTSNTTMEGLLRALFAVFIFYGSYILLRSVRREIKQKEELQVLSDQLGRANAHLKELDEMKTEFVSLASHELLTPVSAIEGYLSMILDEHMSKVEDPKTQKYLDNVYKSAKRLARLIADMLNISRIEEGRLSIEKKDINVSDMIMQVIEEVKFKAEERHQKIEFQGNHWQSYADPDKVKEVIINLIGNSIKYSRHPGTITVTVRCVPRQMVESTWTKIENEIKSRPLDDQEAIKSAVDPHYRELIGDEQLMISVKDEGIGIPREELARLFKKFHRVGNYSTQESQGTGLGLYISRALVELQHGRIWADSEGENKGSTFTFTLPELKVKEQIIETEKQIHIDKEQLKPLAKPMKSADEEL